MVASGFKLVKKGKDKPLAEVITKKKKNSHPYWIDPAAPDGFLIWDWCTRIHTEHERRSTTWEWVAPSRRFQTRISLAGLCLLWWGSHGPWPSPPETSMLLRSLRFGGVHSWCSLGSWWVFSPPLASDALVNWGSEEIRKRKPKWVTHSALVTSTATVRVWSLHKIIGKNTLIWFYINIKNAFIYEACQDPHYCQNPRLPLDTRSSMA